MNNINFNEILEAMVDDLAAIEHERWSHWQRHIHSKATKQPDGSLIIAPELVARWEAQINKNYKEMTAEEQESDREQVRRYLPIILAALNMKSPLGSRR
jgi:hypothetical protein